MFYQKLQPYKQNWKIVIFSIFPYFYLEIALIKKNPIFPLTKNALEKIFARPYLQKYVSYDQNFYVGDVSWLDLGPPQISSSYHAYQLT